MKQSPQQLRAHYKLPHRVIPDAQKEQEWNELARVFVARFQQIYNLPPDSLAGIGTFAALDATAVGSAVMRGPENWDGPSKT